MSLYLAALAFPGDAGLAAQTQAKAGVLMGSIAAVVLGGLALRARWRRAGGRSLISGV
jgi:Na+/H+ antiporter NhaA